MYHQFNVHKFYVLPTQCVCVFCVDLRTNSDYFLNTLHLLRRTQYRYISIAPYMYAKWKAISQAIIRHINTKII
jgi:hypothetical protein